MKLRRRIALGLFAFLSGFAPLLIPQTTAYAAPIDNRGGYNGYNAASGSCAQGMTQSRNYFGNNCTDATDDLIDPPSAAVTQGVAGDRGFVLPRYADGRDALAGVNTVAELYNKIRAAALSSEPRQRAGGAFIVHTMLGRNGDQANAAGGKNVTAADLTELLDRMNNPALTYNWAGSYSSRFNTASRDVFGGDGSLPPYDVSFTDRGAGMPNVPAIIISYAGSPVYIFEKICANPLGDLEGLPDTNWTSTVDPDIYRVNPGAPTTAISAPLGMNWPNGRVGERYGWFWRVTNNGPSATNATVQGSRSWVFPTSSSGWTTSGMSSRAAGVAAGANIFNLSNIGYTPVIQPSDAGKTFCLQGRYSPSNSSGSTYTSPIMCVTVLFDYDLIPSVSMTPTTAEMGSTPPTATYSIRNNGPSDSEGILFRVKEFIAQPGETVATAIRNGVLTNCSIPTTVSGCATDVYTSPNGIVFDVGTTPLNVGPLNTATNTYPIPPINPALMNSAAGTQICRLIAVSKGTESITSRWGAPACVTIGKKPYVKISNGDAWAGGSFQALSATCTTVAPQNGGFTGDFSTVAGLTYGSYGEYQLFGIGPVNGFASGGKVINGGLLSSSLTYKGPTTLGQFYDSTTVGVADLTSHCLGDANSFYGGTASAGTIATTNVTPASLASGIWRRTGDLVLDAGGVIPAGRHIIIIATGKVTINGNIQLAPGTYANLRDIPSVTIIAGTNVTAANKNIEVSSAVTRLDGFFQTYGNFVTCYQSPNGGLGLDAVNCQDQLVVNGAVTANKLVLRRIEGSDLTSRAVPGEIFNLRSDIFLSAYGDAQTSTQLRTTSEQELPPRY